MSRPGTLPGNVPGAVLMLAIVVLQITLLAAPDASFGEQGSGPSGRCAAYGRRPPAAIDARAPTSLADDVGREALAFHVGDGSVQILGGEAAREVFGRAEEPPPARLELRSSDIVRVSWTDDGVAVLLNESGRKALEEFTATNLNRPGMVTIDGMPTSPRAPVINGIVDSGAVGVSKDALRGPLCETLEAAPQAHR